MGYIYYVRNETTTQGEIKRTKEEIRNALREAKRLIDSVENEEDLYLIWSNIVKMLASLKND